MAKSKITSQEFYEFRTQKVQAFEEGKIKSDELANSTYGFILKNHIKATVKPKNREQLLLNILYQITYIERKIVCETELIKFRFGTEESLKEVLKIYLKRRDKMVRKLLESEKPKTAYALDSHTIEFELADGMLLQSSRAVFEELKLSWQENQSPKFQKYIQIFILPYALDA